MFRKIGRCCLALGGLLFRVGLFANIFLLFLIFGTVARQELSYHLRYNNAYVQIEREHERQLAVAIIQSQNAWFDQAELLKFQYLEQRAAVNQLSMQLQLLDKEFYHFIKTLQETDLEAYTKVMEQLNKASEVEGCPLFFGEPTPADGEPTPADPATRPERKTNEA